MDEIIKCYHLIFKNIFKTLFFLSLFYETNATKLFRDIFATVILLITKATESWRFL